MLATWAPGPALQEAYGDAMWGRCIPRIPPPPCPHHYWRSPESSNFPQCRLSKCPGSPHLQLESHLQPLGSQKTSCSPWPSPSACRVTVPGIDLRTRGEPDKRMSGHIGLILCSRPSHGPHRFPRRSPQVLLHLPQLVSSLFMPQDLCTCSSRCLELPPP